ncbi:MAG TPA: ABC transporter permease [Gemmatimonadaceae bacterium]|nr:ABC transporter permease [Gemmatimonadaceae bacterium]
MSPLRRLRRLFELPATARSIDRAVDEELQFHLDARIEALIAAGMSRDQARAAALREFGDMRAAHDQLAAIDRRRIGHEQRAEWWGALTQDVRFAARTLIKQRAFTLAIVLTLALGIGATTAIFSVVDGVLLRPLPYPNHDRLVLAWSTARLGGERQVDLPFPPANFTDLRERSRSFEALAAFRSWGFTLGDGEGTELLQGARVSAELFAVLGVRPMLGRGLVAADDQPGAARVVLVGHALWRRQFGSDPGVIGRQITLNGERVTVVGVMPPGFQFPRGAELPSGFQFPPRTEVWVPLGFSPEQAADRGTWNLAVAGLLKAGVTLPQARAEVASVMRRIGDENGMESIELSGDLIAMRDHSVRSVRSALLLLLGAVGLVLLIACANVTNLLVVRTAARQRELAVRAALGAGRGRLVRQLLTENILIALAGGVLGLLSAVALRGSLLALAPSNLPRLDDIVIDLRVAGVALAVSLVAGSVFGLLGARHAGRDGTAAALREGGRSGSGVVRSRLRHALIAGEVALSLVLLVSASLFLQSFVRMQRVEPGFEPEGVVTADLFIPIDPARDFDEQAPHWRVVVESFLERARALPGVVAAGLVSSLPLTGAWESTAFTIASKPAATPGERPRAQYVVVTPGYLEAMRIGVVRGRGFEGRDRADAQLVVLVSEEAAKRYWRGNDPLGERIGIFGDTTNRVVVGVVRDVRQTALADPVEPTVYLPAEQFPAGGGAFVVRASGDPASLVPALRRELRAVEPIAALSGERLLADVVAESLAQRRFAMVVVGFFAASALLLAAVGLYGVIAYAVGQRTHEIGIRMALGAQRRDVLMMVLRQGLVLALIGLAVGSAGALMLSRVIQQQLFEVRAADPATFGAIGMLLLAVALVASWIPARRATRVDPVGALRE